MLQISHLFADYGGKPALADINLTLDSGELLVVLGPSGCGKTTLLNLIAGFVPYQHGSIVLEGQRVTGRAPNAAWSFSMKACCRGVTYRITWRWGCSWRAWTKRSVGKARRRC
ncbi:Fe(3+) ions import ATP-binding protein FbpC [Raoultella terrigena]|uniref:Fe(3+) ions import ATP-binding protein FbpC n=1 Tax=Raoultella terrigena TaxID=577 RepID=A0A3P8M4B2_RAOTE|nr:Fe(3+) ions import ATP-binding protein FbpC [Raoultella terrigena]